MAYRPRGSNTRRIVGIVLAVAVQAGLVLGLAAGLVQNYAKKVIQDVTTTVLPPKEKPPDTPPPPPPKVDTPPPSVPVPDLQIVAPQSGNPPTAVQHTTHPNTSGLQLPRPRGGTLPEYPPREKQLGHEGRVTLHLCVDVNGTITEASVAASSGYPALDESALNWARSIHWSPARIDGQVQQSYCWDQPYRFQLKNQ